MNHMFADSTVYSLDLGCFNTGKVTDMSGMFENCTNLEHVYVSRQFVVTGVPEESILFSGCQGLSGEAGTEFSSEKDTAVYARIDGGEAAPGYFSRSELYYDG
jgi:surface protein